MPTGKSLAGDAFQVAFRVSRFGLIGEGKAADSVPRPALDGRRVFSCIVAGKAHAKIAGESDRVTTVVACALQKVHVVHDPSSAGRNVRSKFAEHPNFGVARRRALTPWVGIRDSVEDESSPSPCLWWAASAGLLHPLLADASQPVDSACQPWAWRRLAERGGFESPRTRQPKSLMRMAFRLTVSS